MLKRLAEDLTVRLGRGFSERNIRQMRLFYLGWPKPRTVSAEWVDAGIRQTPSAKSGAWPQFPLPWSHYVRLLSVAYPMARQAARIDAARRLLSAGPARLELPNE